MSVIHLLKKKKLFIPIFHLSSQLLSDMDVLSQPVASHADSKGALMDRETHRFTASGI